MNIYFAPLEGITGFVLRNAYESCFPGTIDRYFAPFIAASCRKKLAARDLRDVLPENNKELPIVPQILTNRAGDFLLASKKLAELGYGEINLNLGCPSGTVTAKKKGYTIDETCETPLLQYYEKRQTTDARTAGNGRMVRNLVEDAILNQSRRLTGGDVTSLTEAELAALLSEDFDLSEG